MAVVSLSSNSSHEGSAYRNDSSTRGSSVDYADKESIQSSLATNAGRIPPALRLDEILDGHTCPPASVRNFNQYLQHVEFSSENLAFVLWFRDYQKRFDELPEQVKAMSPPVTSSVVDAMSTPRVPQLRVRGRQPTEASEKTAATVVVDDEKTQGWGLFEEDAASSDNVSIVFDPSQQPLRSEVNQIVVTFLTSNGSKELNLPSNLRLNTIRAAQSNTHPSVFQAVYQHVYYLLYASSHPNFIRFVICNGNRPRVWFARGLGIVTMLLGFLVAGLLVGLGVPRAWRCFAIPLWLIGCATLVGGIYGMCVVLHGFAHRQLRPWELLTDDEDASIVTYKRSSIRTLLHIFDKEVWIEEPALRQLHSRVFFQALFIAVIFTGIMTAIFLSVP